MRRFMLLQSLMLIFAVSLSAQQGNCVKPDSLKSITISGTVTVDTTYDRAKYFLEADGDTTLDYMLNFGPHWYTPDSSDAVRPQDGDIVTIFGGVNCDSCNMINDLQVIIVYEIDGLFWRDPFEPYWNYFLGKRKGHGYGHGNHHGYSMGWLADSLLYTEVSGNVMIDTTFNYWHFYLDSDGDTIPDYHLNFGPPWYVPESGLEKPADGELVTIFGALKSGDSYPVIVVLQLNGEVWRDTTGFGGRETGGGWVHKNMNQHRYIHTPFDTACGMEVRTGWHTGQGQGMSDSMFCQMLQLFPENVPGSKSQNTFAAFETGVFNQNCMNLMVRNDSAGGKLQFASKVRFQFHYNDIQALGYNINESTIQLKNWDPNSQTWEVVPDAFVDIENNTVTYESETINGLTLLTASENLTSIGSSSGAVPAKFTLQQNYPNPFNPSTNIEFSLKQNAKVVLTVYNVLGQKISEILNTRLQAGEYKIPFMAGNLTSGMYFCELKSGDVRQIIRMTLIK